MTRRVGADGVQVATGIRLSSVAENTGRVFFVARLLPGGVRCVPARRIWHLRGRIACAWSRSGGSRRVLVSFVGHRCILAEIQNGMLSNPERQFDPANAPGMNIPGMNRGEESRSWDSARIAASWLRRFSRAFRVPSPLCSLAVHGPLQEHRPAHLPSHMKLRRHTHLCPRERARPAWHRCR